MINAAMSWTSLAGEVPEERQVSQSLWFAVYLWMETIPEDSESAERSFVEDNLILFVQMFRGQLRYVFGAKPHRWHFLEELV